MGRSREDVPDRMSERMSERCICRCVRQNICKVFISLLLPTAWWLRVCKNMWCRSAIIWAALLWMAWTMGCNSNSNSNVLDAGRTSNNNRMLNAVRDQKKCVHQQNIYWTQQMFRGLNWIVSPGFQQRWKKWCFSLVSFGQVAYLDISFQSCGVCSYICHVEIIRSEVIFHWALCIQ